MKQFLFWGLAMLAPLTVRAATLAERVEQAWQRQPQAAASAAHAELFAARQAQTADWLPAPPAASLRYTGDQAGLRQGLQRWEGEVSVALWQAGQRDERRRTTTADEDAWRADLRLQRWQLAGHIRELLWQGERQRRELATAERHLAVLSRLADDVARRVAAGELAPVDLNDARLARSAAERAVLQARARVQQDDAALLRLTGLPADAGVQPEAESPGVALEQHPALAVAERRVEALRARLDLARTEGRTPPEVALGWSREQDERGAPANTLVTIGVRLPLGRSGEARQADLQIQTELAAAMQEREQARRQVEQDTATAREQLATALQVLQLTRQDLQLARQNRDWLARAHAMGEQGLPALLRAENALSEAEAEQERAAIDVELARARLNQAQGVMP